MSVVTVVCCLCDKLITRPEEPYQLWCVVVCDIKTAKMTMARFGPKSHGGWGNVD